jgi:hypothetical protein
MAETKRPLSEFQARAIQNVVAMAQSREIAVLLVGEPGAEENDLALRLPVGAVPALAIQLHAACADMDKSVADVTVAAQPLAFTGAQAAMRIMGHPALSLSLGGFQVPVVLPSDETARQIIDALEKAVQINKGSGPAKN